MPASADVGTLARAVHDCRGCELWGPATQAVFSSGPASAALVLVGEQPGDREDQEGEPFVGPAGRILADALHAADLDPDQVYLTNAVKHFRFTAVITTNYFARMVIVTCIYSVNEQIYPILFLFT